MLPPAACFENAPMTGPLLDGFWAWAQQGCPCPLPAGDPQADTLLALRSAVTSADRLLLGALASHRNDWVRLAVAANPDSPVWALWGDSARSFGLAGDANLWVRSTALLRQPRPPTEAVNAFVSSHQQTQKGL